MDGIVYLITFFIHVEERTFGLVRWLVGMWVSFGLIFMFSNFYRPINGTRVATPYE